MTFVARPPRDVVVASGADAMSFLQSLVSQDLEGLGNGDSVHSLLLTPQGKFDVDFMLLMMGEAACLICEGGYGQQLVTSLERFKIRVEVDLAVESRYEVLAVREAEARREWPDAHAIPVPWPDSVAYDVVGAAIDPIERELIDAGAERRSGDEYEAARIRAGVPRQGYELDEKTIPQEAFLDRDAVSFTKGCFMGQELVCRIDTRGHVNRYLRRLEVEGRDVPRGAEIVAAEKVVGAVTSSAGDSALGYVRREVEPRADVRLRWDGGDVAARVEVLPNLRAE